jgi:hypothetical protein
MCQLPCMFRKTWTETCMTPYQIPLFWSASYLH